MGTAHEGRPKEVRDQVSSILRRAVEALGSHAHLAMELGVTRRALDEWIDGVSDCPDEIVNMAVEIIIAKPKRT
jgi:hypothetical protein